MDYKKFSFLDEAYKIHDANERKAALELFYIVQVKGTDAPFDLSGNPKSNVLYRPLLIRHTNPEFDIDDPALPDWLRDEVKVSFILHGEAYTQYVNEHFSPHEVPEPIDKPSYMEAADIVSGSRKKQGKERSFKRIAKLWSGYLQESVTPQDVAMMMLLLKAARIKDGISVSDSFTDIHGYAILAEEMTK